MADDIDIGIAVRTDPAAATAVDQLRARLTGLRDMLAKLAAAQADLAGGASLEGLVLQANEAAAGINQTIGAFTKLGQAVDASNAKAVAAFREEGLALALYLEELGATDAEINKVAASIARLEQRAGAARFGLPAQQPGAPTPTPIAPPALPPVPKIPPVPEATISSFDRVAPKLRTAANAASLLAIAAATGTGSLQGMAVAAGSVAIGIGALVAGPIGGLLSALGAIATLAVTAIGLWKEAHQQLDATMRALDEGEQARLERIAGADAAQAAAITRQANREKQAVEAGKGTAKQKADAIAAIEAAADEKRAALEKKRRDQEAKDVQAALDATSEAVEKRVLNDEQQQTEALTREFEARRKALNDQLALAERDPDPTRSKDRVDALKTQLDALTREETNRRLKIAQDAARERAQVERDTNAQILDLIGQHTAAARLRIEEQYDELLRTLKQKGVANAEAIARSFLDAEAAKVALEDIDRATSTTFDASQNALARINILLNAHAITAADARQQTVAALEAERQAILRQIAALEELAQKFPGNPETLAKIDAAKTQLLGLTAEIQHASDSLAEIKETARGATTDAIAGFLQDLSKLGTQDRTQIRALTGDLRAAQDELRELLAIPATERTGEVNTRISQLRGEIAATSAQLDQARSSITTWRDLFVSALQSIADALIRVSSQMLATAFVEKLLGINTLGSGVQPTLSGGPSGLSGPVNVASGGYIRGPGTATSDSIPARLSNGEYVIRAARVQSLGREFFDAINFAGATPSIRSGRYRYADGGYVQSARTIESARPESIDRLHVSLESGLIARVVMDVLTSPAGREIVVKHATGNGRQLGIR